MEYLVWGYTSAAWGSAVAASHFTNMKLVVAAVAIAVASFVVSLVWCIVRRQRDPPDNDNLLC